MAADAPGEEESGPPGGHDDTPLSSQPSAATDTTPAAKLDELKRKQRQEIILRRAIPILLTVPWFIGIIWMALHPLVSVITGELKCRGQYIDENGLDVHRHRVESYPLERVELSNKNVNRREDASISSGMCDAINSVRLPDISPSVECLHHAATDSIAFDVVRILPPMGPIIESTEAVVLIVGENRHVTQQEYNKNNQSWYDRSDLHPSIIHLIKKLGSKKDCPWLSKSVFIVSPAKNMATSDPEMSVNVNASMHSAGYSSSLGLFVDAFITSYLGGDGVRPLPPEFTFPVIRSMVILHDAEATNRRTEVRILPQGVGGTLPNLDLVFAAFLSFQSRPAGDRTNPANSIFYGDSEIRMHPFGSSFEERAGKALGWVGNVIGLKETAVKQYAKDLSGLFGFVAGMVIGPRQPHALALNHGIDALTLEVRIPGDRVASSSAIHPHYADLTRCVEHLLRSISNLHERLHHSIAQYTMPSPSKFVSHGEYIYSGILVSLPMVVRAAQLALRDLKRFQFLHTGIIFGSVCVASSLISLCAISTNERREPEYCSSEWTSHVMFFISYLLVVVVARHQCEWADVNNQKDHTHSINAADECRGSLRFLACLLGIYLHAPLLLANYSLGFASAVFWSPILATFVLPPSLHVLLLRKKLLLAFSIVVKCLFLFATSPPIVLVPRVFHGCYTPYVLGVYTPLHFVLVALWAA